MKQTESSPWVALTLGVAVTVALYALALRLVPHGGG
jgi:hypothetical protein